MNKNEAIEFLLEKPYLFGHMLGFTKLTELHNRWILDMVRGTEDTTLQAHRGSFKTTCVSIALVLMIILLPSKKIVFIRKTGGDVDEIMMQVQKILLDPHTIYFVKAIYGVDLKMTTQSRGRISTNLSTDNKGTPQLVGMGTQSSITGRHFDRIFTDDIVNVQDRQSRAERDRVKLFYQELQNIKNVGGRIFNTGTPWHKDDCFTLMPNPETYSCYVTGLLSDEEIATLKSKMTASLFAANYEMKHIADDDVIFTNPQTGGDANLVMQGTSHVDAAFYGEDYTAFTVLAIHDGKYYVFGKCWRKHIDNVMDEIVEWHNHFNAGRMWIELNADKGYVAKQFRNRNVRVMTYTESQNKYIKIVSHLKFEWENVVFVEGTDAEYIEQICEFTDTAPHDDCPDSLSSLIRALSRKRTDSYQSIYGG